MSKYIFLLFVKYILGNWMYDDVLEKSLVIYVDVWFCGKIFCFWVFYMLIYKKVGIYKLEF